MDQAENLRKKLNKINRSKLITITSGKGGVGKSNIAVNLGIYLSRLGYRIVIIDADLGLGNVDVIMGINTRYNLLDVLHGEKSILDVMENGPENIKFISAGSGIEELADIDNMELDYLIQNFSLLDYCADYIIVDTGAGISEIVKKFILAADEMILVITPEPTSITDGYALLKTINKYDKKKNFNFIVNKVESRKEAIYISEKISTIIERFLSVQAKYLGYIIDDRNIIRSVKSQVPIAIGYPKSNASKCLYEIAVNMTNKKSNKYGGIKRLLSLLQRS